MTPKSTPPRDIGSDHYALPFATELARASGMQLLGWFGNAEVQMKADGTTLTKADTALDSFICGEIQTNFPDDLIISEEMYHSHETEHANVWVIDPLD
ncbi:MAG: inositol monophosphatase family protein, partial [Anaerolineales bacterium]|nr:inositol monophosphatase family protein [Anaerolineales bacterium]